MTSEFEKLKKKRQHGQALSAEGECPRCGSGAELLESFYPRFGGRFKCKKCGHDWSEG